MAKNKQIYPMLSLLLLVMSNMAQGTDGAVLTEFDPSISNVVGEIKLQENGQILIGGSFKFVEGSSRNGIARLNSDGSLDAGFDPNLGSSINPLFPGTPFDIELQPNGSVLLGGNFSTVGGTLRRRLARVDSEGVLDSSLDLEPNGSVIVISIGDDGDIFVGGEFTQIEGSNRNRIAKISTDGVLDSDFTPSVNSGISSMEIQSNGGIIIGGSFSEVNGLARNGIARILQNGNLDMTFDPNVNGGVFAIEIADNDEIIIGGDFSAVGGFSRSNIAKLASNGALITDFSSQINGIVLEIKVQPDGKYLVGGAFTQVDSAFRSNVARLNADGTFDSLFSADAFRPNSGRSVQAIEYQSNNQILIGGLFSSVGGVQIDYMARLENGIGQLAVNSLQLEQVEGSDQGISTNVIEFEITRSANSIGVSSVDYSAAGSGLNPADENDFGGVFPSGSLTFEEDEQSKTVPINIFGDIEQEPNETFELKLSNPINAKIIKESDVSIIANDDGLDTPCFPVQSKSGALVLICL